MITPTHDLGLAIPARSANTAHLPAPVLHPRPLRIAGSGAYLPKRIVQNSELESRLGVPAGWVERKTGIRLRHYADPETEPTYVMAARAIEAAMHDAGYNTSRQTDTDAPPADLLLCASAIGARPLPATSCLVQRELGPAWTGVPCMDLNCTCLGFLAALDLAASHFAGGHYRRIVVVCSEMASLGMNWEHPESAALFGDAAVAFILETSSPHSAFARSRADSPTQNFHPAAPALLHSRLATFSEGADTCTVRGGGLNLPAWKHTQQNHADYLFHMDGARVHALASRHLPPFMVKFLSETGLALNEIDLVVPHQAGLLSMRIMQRKLGIPPERFVITIGEHGNVISASIPLALHLSRQNGRAHTGQRVLLLGTAAGLTLGAALLQL